MSSGVKSVNLHDTETVTMADFGAQFFLRESDVGTNRAVASFQRGAEMNSCLIIALIGCNFF